MKKLCRTLLFLFLSICANAALAEMALTSKDDLLGTWKLKYTKNSATAKESITREDTWIFKDGKVEILNIPREGSHYNQAPVTYEVEDNKLKIPYVGRSGFDTFTLLEKEGSSMILKGKFGEQYYFEKK